MQRSLGPQTGSVSRVTMFTTLGATGRVRRPSVRASHRVWVFGIGRQEKCIRQKGGSGGWV